MERVAGIGGIFFGSKDSKKLAKCYCECLGVDPVPKDYDTVPWNQETGPTVFAPFPEDNGYFGDPQQVWMINFRVPDLDAMVAQLESKGVEVKVDPGTYPNGRFDRIYDPDRDPVELREPSGK